MWDDTWDDTEFDRLARRLVIAGFAARFTIQEPVLTEADVVDSGLAEAAVLFALTTTL